MATTYADRGKPNFPVASMGLAGALRVAWGIYTLAANPSAADITKMCKLPKGATPLFGYIGTTDIDTGTEALDIDVGFASNGVDTGDADYFTNGGVYTGDALAVTDLPFTNSANLRFFTGPFPTVTTFGAETDVQVVYNAPANAGGTGTILVVVLYALD